MGNRASITNYQPQREQFNVRPLIDGCEVCHKNDNQDVMVICDRCEKEFHTYCVGLSAVPEKREWFCNECVVIKEFCNITVEENDTPTPMDKEDTTSPKGVRGDIPPTINKSDTPKGVRGDIPPTINKSDTPKGVRGDIPPINTTSPKGVRVDIPPTINKSDTPKGVRVDIPPTINKSDTPKGVRGDIPPKGANVFIYTRVSTKNQDEPEYGRVGANDQRKVCADFCHDNFHIIHACYHDVGSGGNMDNLQQQKQMIKDLKPKTLIVVYSVSRLGRNTAQIRDVLAQIHAKGCIVYSVIEKVFSTDYENFMIFARVAEHELVTLRQRLRDNYERQKAILGPGRKPVRGVLPFGKKSQRNENNILIAVDHPEEQAIIKFILDSRASRPEKIIRALELQGIAQCRGKPWTRLTIKRIIKQNAVVPAAAAVPAAEPDQLMQVQ